MSDPDPPERQFFRSLRHHRLLWPVIIAAALFGIAAVWRLAHWAGWRP